MEAALVAESLTKRYPDELDAVHDVSFSVGRGQVFGLLGGPRSGKSTTLGMLATLLTPTSGHAEVSGIDVAREPERARARVGIVFPHSSADPDRTARENLLSAARACEVPPIQVAMRSEALLEAVGLVAEANAPVRTLAPGRLRCLELALATVHHPEVLFLDEPTADLDPAAREAFWGAFRQVRAIHRSAVVLASRRASEAYATCDRVAFIDHGRLVASGTRDGLRRMLEATSSGRETTATPGSRTCPPLAAATEGSVSFRTAGDRPR
jgi:ABC-2 type transport system ATP-binding protein